MGQVRIDNIVKWVLIATVAIFAIVKLKNCNKPASDFTDEEIELLNKQKDNLDKETERILIEYDTIYMDRIVVHYFLQIWLEFDCNFHVVF